MSVTWTLIGIGIASVLAGVSAVLLAQRSERREARAGERQLLADLGRAANLLSGTLEGKAVWWQPQHAPSPQAWDLHHRALIGQLPTKVLKLIEQAVHDIRVANATAQVDFATFTERQARHREARQRAEEAAAQAGKTNPAQAVADDDATKKYLAGLEPSRRISETDRPRVQTALTSTRAARDALQRRANQTGVFARLADSWQASLPTLFGAAALVALLLAVAVVQPWRWFSGQISETKVATAITEELDASKADCTLKTGTTGRWTCLVVYGADETCPTSSGGWLAVAHAAEEEKACGQYTEGAELWEVEADKQKQAIAWIDQATEQRVDADEKESVLARGGRLIRGMFRVRANDDDEIRSLDLAPAQ